MKDGSVDICKGCKLEERMRAEIQAVVYERKAKDMTLPCWSSCIAGSAKVIG